MKKPEVVLELMTPTRAAELLATSQQKILWNKVGRLVKEIPKWDPEKHRTRPVHLSADGSRLHNGHHRLHAILRTGVSCEVYVMYLDAT